MTPWQSLAAHRLKLKSSPCASSSLSGSCTMIGSDPPNFTDVAVEGVATGWMAESLWAREVVDAATSFHLARPHRLVGK